MFMIELSEAEGRYLLELCRRDHASLEKRIDKGRRTGSKVPELLLSSSNIAGGLQSSFENLLGIYPHLRAAYVRPSEEGASL